MKVGCVTAQANFLGTSETYKALQPTFGEEAVILIRMNSYFSSEGMKFVSEMIQAQYTHHHHTLSKQSPMS
jgi:lysine/ornithine N-monooxygenase